MRVYLKCFSRIKNDLLYMFINRLKIKELTTKFHYCRHCGIDFSCDKHLQAHFKESHFNTKYRKDRDPYIDYHCKKYENGPFLGFSSLLSYEEHMFAEHKTIIPAEKSKLEWLVISDLYILHKNKIYKNGTSSWECRYRCCI